MVFRPTLCLIKGKLDNTTPGLVTGWMRFAGVEGKVILHLRGNFHHDIRGAKIRFRGEGRAASPDAGALMKGFSHCQSGKAGVITAGLSFFDWWSHPYIEWYSDQNGRVEIDLEEDQMEVIGGRLPIEDIFPFPPEDRGKTLGEFMRGIARRTGTHKRRKRRGAGGTTAQHSCSQNYKGGEEDEDADI